ncbi:MAG: hypothetical protein GC145_18760 [Caulobacter sp.]|nr:hypothetical protein [Caulobacter sp.]
MAASPQKPASDPQQVHDVPIAKVRVGPRLRELDQSWAVALSGIMADEGEQRTPVDVYPVAGTDEFELGPGLHRLKAREIGGHETVRAFIIRNATDFERRSREISENLWRKGLDPLQRAAFISDLVELRRLKAGVADDVSPQSVAATARWQTQLAGKAADACAIFAHAYGLTDEVAEEIGLSRRSVYLDLHLHKAIDPGVANLIRTTAIGRNASQLRALAALAPEEQRKVAAEIVAGRAAKVSEAVDRLTPGKVKPSAEAKRLSAVIGHMSKMGRAERKAALETLNEMYGAEADDA